MHLELILVIIYLVDLVRSAELGVVRELIRTVAVDIRLQEFLIDFLFNERGRLIFKVKLNRLMALTSFHVSLVLRGLVTLLRLLFA